MRRTPDITRARLFSAIAALCLLLLIAGPGEATTPDHLPAILQQLDEVEGWGAPPMVDRSAEDDEAEEDEDEDEEELGDISTEFERRHQRILENLQQTAVWLDSFFGSERIDENQTAESELRVSWENSFRESQNPNTRLKMRGKLRLPHMQHKLQLVFEGEPDESDPSGLDQENASSALRYSVARNALRSIDFDVGFRGGLSDPRLFTRLRMQKLLLNNRQQLHRLTPAVTWDSRLGWELYVRHDAEFKPREKLFFRATTKPGWSQDADGYTLQQDFTIFYEASPHRFIALDWLNDAVVHPYSDLTSRIRVRHRRALRENQLYLEFAPGLRFAEENDFRTQWEGYISLEVVFSPHSK